jgi:hypothetical protein
MSSRRSALHFDSRSPESRARARDPDLRRKGWREDDRREYRDRSWNSYRPQYRGQGSSKFQSETTPSSKSSNSTPKAPKKTKFKEDEERDKSKEEALEKDLKKKTELAAELETEKTAMKESIAALKEEMTDKNQEITTLKKELADKKKEVNKQETEKNALKRKKEKEGTLDILRHTIKKNDTLKEDKKKLNDTISELQEKVKSLENKIKKNGFDEKETDLKIEKYREERNVAEKREKTAKDDLAAAELAVRKEKSARLSAEAKLRQASRDGKAAAEVLEETKSKLKVAKNDVERIRAEREKIKNEKKVERSSRVKPVFKSQNKGNEPKETPVMKTKESATENKDASMVESMNNSLSTPTSDEGDNGNDVTKTEGDEENPSEEFNDENLNGGFFETPSHSSTPKKTRENDEDLDAMEELGIEELEDEDSFMNPPEIKIGKHTVKNFTKRRSQDAQPSKAQNYKNRNFTATSLNNQIFFIAVSETAKTEHDANEHGTKPCGLHPYCSNLLKGGESIAKVFVISPDFHKYYEKECWGCAHHADASIEGLELQIQKKNDAKETPKAEDNPKPTIVKPTKNKLARNKEKKIGRKSARTNLEVKMKNCLEEGKAATEENTSDYVEDGK